MTHAESQAGTPTEGAAIIFPNSSQASVLDLFEGSDEATQMLEHHRDSVSKDRLNFMGNHAQDLAVIIAANPHDSVVHVEQAQAFLRKHNFQLETNFPLDDINLLEYVISEAKKASQIAVAVTLQAKLEAAVGQIDDLDEMLEAYPEVKRALEAKLRVSADLRTRLPVTDLLDQIQHEEAERLATHEIDTQPKTVQRAVTWLAIKAMDIAKNSPWHKHEQTVETS